MRLLLLGGTSSAGRAIAQEPLDRGQDVELTGPVSALSAGITAEQEARPLG